MRNIDGPLRIVACVVIACVIGSAHAEAQVRPGIFSTAQTTDTSSTSLLIGCALNVTSACTGGIVAGTAKFTTGIATDAATVPTHGIAMASGVPSSTSFVLYNNSGTLTWNGTPLAAGSSVSGTLNAIPRFTASTSIGDSIMAQDAGATTITVTGTFNATTAIQLNGTSINTGGTLTNVAYLDQANYFNNASGQRFSAGIAVSNATASTQGIAIASAVPGSVLSNLFNNASILTWQGASATNLGLQLGSGAAGNNTAVVTFAPSNSATNWQVGANVTASSLTWTPSTVGGGTTFSTPAMSLTGAGLLTFTTLAASAGNVSGTFTVATNLRFSDTGSGAFAIANLTNGGTTSISTFDGSTHTATMAATGAWTFPLGITAGSGSVGIIDSTGKIPAISTTYFASVSGANLTTLNADNLSSGTVPTGRMTGSYTGITGVGTLTAGTWNATVIGALYGGTGQDTSASTGVAQVATGTWSVSTTLQNAVQDNITRLGTVTTGSFPAANLTGTTLASNVVTSSLTTVGALNAGSITSGFGAIDVGADAVSGGAASFTTGAFSGNLTINTNKFVVTASSGAMTQSFAQGQAFIQTGTSYIYNVVTSDAGSAYFGMEAATAGGVYTNALNGSAFVVNGANLPLQFGTNGAARMTISAAGGVSVGNTTDPGATNLSVTGTATAASFIPTSSSVPTNGMYLSAANTLAFATNSSARQTIDSTGLFTSSLSTLSGTLTISATSVFLSGVGASGSGDVFVCRDAGAPNEVQVGATCLGSSREFKRNIQTLDGDEARNILMLLRPVSFDWIDGRAGLYGGTRDISLIAEEASEADRRLGLHNIKTGDIFSVNDRALLGLAIRVIQEQHKDIERLKQRMD